MKTRKSVSKRFKVTKTGKIMRRAIGQGHYRAKRTGKQIREGRKWVKLSGPLEKKVKKLLSPKCR